MKRSLLVAALALFSTGACIAAPAPVRVEHHGGARISKDRFAATLDDGFARLDANRSGTVTWDEWRRIDTTPEARRDFEALDANRDEQISSDEWTSRLGQSGAVVHVFTYLETNRDAQLAADQSDRGPIAALFSITF